MPGPYIHIASADNTAEHLSKLKKWPDYAGNNNASDEMSPEDLARIAKNNDHFYSLGAIGPDLFYFIFLPDFRPRGWAKASIFTLEYLDELYRDFDEWILTREERYLGPIWEDSSEAVSRLTGDLSSVVAEDFKKLASIFLLGWGNILSQSYDWFGLFSLGFDEGYDNKDFAWSDMLHYRKTSKFGNALWIIAGQMEREAGTTLSAKDAKALGDSLRAYALGYMTHLGTDVTGHAFVNEKTGGPFRTHWQRHHLVENHMDAQCYDVDHGQDPRYNMFTKSALYYRLLFGDDAGRTPPQEPIDTNSLRGAYDLRRELDADSELPDEVGELIYRAMEMAYDTGGPGAASVDQPSLTTPQIIPDNLSVPSTVSNILSFPNIIPGVKFTMPQIAPGNDGRPDPKIIQTAFSWFFRYFKYITVDGFSCEKPTPPEAFPNLDFPQLTDPHDSAPGASDPDPDLLDWFLAILRFLLWIVEIAIWIATLVPGILADSATYGPRLAAYYAIDLPLYYMVKAERLILVMTGYLMPMQDEIELGLVTLCVGSRKLFLTLLDDMDDALGGLLKASGVTLQPAGTPTTELAEHVPDPQYPHSIKVDSEGHPIEFHAPWCYPDSPMEASATVAGPYECGAMAHVLLEDAMPGNQALRSKLEGAASPLETDFIAKTMNRQNNMGDPAHFSAYLIWQLAREKHPVKETDWNLDADRGYGYKCWDWDRCKSAKRLVDGTGHLYLEPRGQTPQKPGGSLIAPTVNLAYNPSVPLKIHYLDGDPPPLSC